MPIGYRHVPQPFQVHDLLAPLHIAPCARGHRRCAAAAYTPLAPPYTPYTLTTPYTLLLPVQPLTPLTPTCPPHTLTHLCIPLHPLTSPYTPLHPLTPPYTPLHPLTGALQPHLRAGDTFVDFACGLNTFAPLLKDPGTGEALNAVALEP